MRRDAVLRRKASRFRATNLDFKTPLTAGNVRKLNPSDASMMAALVLAVPGYQCASDNSGSGTTYAGVRQ